MIRFIRKKIGFEENRSKRMSGMAVYNMEWLALSHKCFLFFFKQETY